jgi:hypothetical protein
MGVANDGGSNQHKDSGPNDGADSEARQVPGREGFFQPMDRVVGVGKDLFKRLGPEQLGDHRAPIDTDRGQGRLAKTFVMVHIVSSIAGGL